MTRSFFKLVKHFIRGVDPAIVTFFFFFYQNWTMTGKIINNNKDFSLHLTDFGRIVVKQCCILQPVTRQ